MDEKLASPVSSSHSASSLDDPAAKVQELKRIYRKIDLNIVPLMFFCYFLQFLDKVLVNYANIMGISKALHFVGNDFSWMATAFFIGYAVAEFPQGYLIQKFPVSKVLGFNVLLWGIVVCCTAATQSFASVAAVRTLLGMFEAVITPALVMITSQWYTRKQATLRTGIWYCGLGAGQVMGGLISWAAQHGSTTSSFQGWRIMFVAVGVFNLFVAVAVILLMPNSITSAKFLTEDEKALVEEVLARDQAGSGKKVFHVSGIWDALKDLQVWLLFVNTILIVIPSGIITTFSATIINSIFLTPMKSALLNMPAGAISIFATLAGSYAIYFNLPRWLSIIALLIPTIIGAALMSFAKSKGGALAGVYLINFDVAPPGPHLRSGRCQHAGIHEKGYRQRHHCHCLLHRKHHRPTDVPGQGCAPVSSRQNHRSRRCRLIHCGYDSAESPLRHAQCQDGCCPRGGGGGHQPRRD
ncbi:uncharacterized protein TrAtP1_008725 [Trichoderma atroviride]|uniref:uncharacterized protein n=1 Tax=Hypocrea atroviridis TaxID=63577 RepID=UPI00332ADD40|nr:hypothetical protein TrAtP1_008725 [Trichoderma atroviride]